MNPFKSARTIWPVGAQHHEVRAGIDYDRLCKTHPTITTDELFVAVNLLLAGRTNPMWSDPLMQWINSVALEMPTSHTWRYSRLARITVANAITHVVSGVIGRMDLELLTFAYMHERGWIHRTSSNEARDHATDSLAYALQAGRSLVPSDGRKVKVKYNEDIYDRVYKVASLDELFSESVPKVTKTK